MTKKTDGNNEDLQKKLDKIIDRTKAQNRLLNKLLEDINSGKPVSKEINEKQ